MKAFQVHSEDTVATLLDDCEGGDVQIIESGKRRTIRASEPIALGHKIAVSAMNPGDPVKKYGITIGTAIKPIQIGQWVHLHNCRSGVDERSGNFDIHSGESGDVNYE